jgi:hypothetical protein
MRALDIEVHAHLILREANELAGDGVSSLVNELVERVLPVGAWQKFSQVSAVVCISHKSTIENAFSECVPGLPQMKGPLNPKPCTLNRARPRRQGP